MSVEKEILQVTGIKRKPKEDQQRYLERIVNLLAPKEGSPDFDELDAAAEKMWANLSENAQAWVDGAIAAIDNSSSIPSFSKYDVKKKAKVVEKEVAEEDEEDVEGEEETEETEEETEEATEDEEEEESRPAKASKAVKKAASKDDEDLEEEASDQEDNSEGNEQEEDDAQTEQESSMKKPAKKLKGKAKAKGAGLASGATKAKTTNGAAKKPGRTSKFNPDMKITVLAKENPRRPNTRTYDIFNYYKTGMTVGDFLAKKDARLVDIKADVERGHIKVS